MTTIDPPEYGVRWGRLYLWGVGWGRLYLWGWGGAGYTCLVSQTDVPETIDFNDTHKRHEALVVKVGAHAKVLTVTGKVVPLVNVNTTHLVCHNLKGGGGGRM